LLSGGLDTSILAAVTASRGRKLFAVSVAVSDGPCTDEPFATRIAAKFTRELRIIRPSLRRLLEFMPEVVKVLQTFDPIELRNSVVAYVALQAAKDCGHSTCLTGDAADELFAGYSFMFNKHPEQLPDYIRFLNSVMQFTSIPLAASLGGRAELPYLTSEIRDFALSLRTNQLVGEMNGKCFGKKILRQAFQDMLPPDIVWRIKTPIEYGSGSTAMPQLAAGALSDSDFEQARHRAQEQDGVQLRDKEQCLYYQMYREIFPPSSQREGGAKRCLACKGPVEHLDMRFCRICGAYPI
jgi:asparagine synthase (glutamine-hydrolysing)